MAESIQLIISLSHHDNDGGLCVHHCLSVCLPYLPVWEQGNFQKLWTDLNQIFRLDKNGEGPNDELEFEHCTHGGASLDFSTLDVT